MTNEPIYLIDGTSICYRSFYALKLSNSKGLPTGAVYGFYNTLKKIHALFGPQLLAMCFDVSRKTFRQEKYKEYKINRPPSPDGLKIQIPFIKRLVALMGLAVVEKDGFEADDIIYTLTKKAVAQNRPTVIVTSDKDMYQLLSESNVTIYNPTQERLIREEDFFKDFGFTSSFIIDYLALAGDASDNIPGAKGIGKVGASKLIQEYHTIENIFAHIDDIAPKTKKILIENKTMVTLSKELVKLASCDIGLDWKDLGVGAADRTGLCTLFSELEFKSLVKDFAQESLTVRLDIKDATAAEIKALNKDTLTFFSEDAIIYICGDNTRLYQISLDAIKDVLADQAIRKISYDFKEQLYTWDGIACAGMWFDIKIAAYVDDPALPDYSLEGLVAHYLGEFVSEIPGHAAPYYIDKLYTVLAAKLTAENLENLFFTVEMPLMKVLRDMESRGVAIDTTALQDLGSEVQTRHAQVSNEIFSLAGKEFNLNSPTQLRVVLFEDLKIPPLSKTKTGYSTNEEVLTKLAARHPIARLLLEHRELTKLKTTYIMPILEAVKRGAGRLHTTFNQTATQTGRLSSSSPNLQSIPARGTFSDALRRTFISSFNEGVI
ncbi:MAG: hypothetical protein KKF80_04135, partial [Candidatus Omnitrophica bacterium]|nr:hypothetical protein [Candidatus Omnitrophota bacterium]